MRAMSTLNDAMNKESRDVSTPLLPCAITADASATMAQPNETAAVTFTASAQSAGGSI